MGRLVRGGHTPGGAPIQPTLPPLPKPTVTRKGTPNIAKQKRRARRGL